MISVSPVSPCSKEKRRGKNSSARSVPSWELSPFFVAQTANRPNPRLWDWGTMWKERFFVAFICSPRGRYRMSWILLYRFQELLFCILLFPTALSILGLSYRLHYLNFHISSCIVSRPCRE